MASRTRYSIPSSATSLTITPFERGFGALTPNIEVFGGENVDTTPLAWASESIGWRPVFAGAVVFTAFATIAVWVVVRDAPPGHPFLARKPEAPREMLHGLVEVLCNPRLRPILALNFILITISTLNTFDMILPLGVPESVVVTGADWPIAMNVSVPSSAACTPANRTTVGPCRGWRRDWRRDHRYDWRRHRDRNRDLFRWGFYDDPFGWNYRPWNIGLTIYPR